jgi:2-dehydro-3-deoxy-D-arabinonate dehydratase
MTENPLMKLCRFRHSDARPRVGLLTENSRLVIDLTRANVERIDELLEEPKFLASLAKCATDATLPRIPLSAITLLPPVDEQEVWAVGVTYLRSKAARMEESDFSATAYDRVYEAPRPELFFKSQPQKVVGPGDTVGIRRDAKWNVPEPELVLVFNSRGTLCGFTIGNDMSSRDIEGENLLYLPQAKIYDRACALGPWIVVGETEKAARTWPIKIRITRAGKEVFGGTTKIDRIKRPFTQLRDYLFRSQTFPHGAMLLTGTGVVPDDTFTLRRGDEIAITVPAIGTLVNTVVVV